MNPIPIWPIDHVGYAVSNLNEAIEWYERTTGSTITLRETLESQGVELAFIDTPTAKIELLAPLRPDSTLGKFIAKRGPGLHHVCYRVSNLKAELERMSALGVRLIDASPRPGAGGSMIAFMHPSSWYGVLTELCEY